MVRLVCMVRPISARSLGYYLTYGNAQVNSNPSGLLTFATQIAWPAATWTAATGRLLCHQLAGNWLPLTAGCR